VVETRRRDGFRCAWCVSAKVRSNVDTGWRGASRAIAARGVGGVVATRRALALDEDMLAVPSALLAWLLGS
jgi:hypothetical protein